MSMEKITGLSAEDLQAVIAIADQIKRREPVRLPVELQIGALAKVTAVLSDLLFLCISGDVTAIAAARELFTACQGAVA